MSASYQHVNRKGETYYLQAKDKDGKRRYSFARKLTGEPVATLPEGYEPREHPINAQVTLRRSVAPQIREDERRLLEQSITRANERLSFIVDADGKELVVYTSDVNANRSVEAMGSRMPALAARLQAMKSFMLAHAPYQQMMRFVLTDAEARLFRVDRWCFKGGIDGWWTLEHDSPLEELARRYVVHLGQDSFFDLV